MADTPAPQQRDARMVPLSHDHHTALGRAREVVLTLDRGAPGDAELETLAHRLQSWAGVELFGHFEKEEVHLIPPYLQQVGPDDGLAAEMARQHQTIRELTRDLTDVSKGDTASRLRAWSTALSEHVRFEERELFAAVQRALTDEQMTTLGKALDGEGPACPVA